MTSRRELCLEQKINLIKDKDGGLSHRELSGRFHISVGAVSNILKRKLEYTNDYETNRNKKLKRKIKVDSSQEINDNVYGWFVSQRSKNIPISGPILQEYARNFAKQLDNSTSFKASNGWLDRFRTRYNIQFRLICGEARSVDSNTVDDWKSRLHSMIEHYNPVDVFNCDETGLFFKMMPDRSLAVDRSDCRGGKKSKERYTVMLCTNWAGTEKLKPLVIGKLIFMNSNSTTGLFFIHAVGKYAKPRCFKNIDMKKLPVYWYSNKSAWMNTKIFIEWIHGLDLSMRKQKRHVLLFLDNAPVHPPDIELENIKLKFFPPNTTAKIQPLDQGIIRAFKAHYRRYLVKHIIASATAAITADDINITALDAVLWIDSAWAAVTEETIRNTFGSAGFERLDVIDGVGVSSISTTTNEHFSTEDKPIEDLDWVLKHLTIGGKSMSAYDYTVRFETTFLIAYSDNSLLFISDI
jgi:hypothetical protein